MLKELKMDKEEETSMALSKEISSFNDRIQSIQDDYGVVEMENDV